MITKPRIYEAQQGAALLSITAILLVVASMGALTMSRVGQVEQRIAGNDVRTKEVYSAALGGLEYGAAWLEDNFPTLVWSDADADGVSEAGDTAFPTALGNLTMNADVYARTITYTLRTEVNPVNVSMPRIIDITATATATGDTHVTKTVYTSVMLASTNFFSPDSEDGMGFAGPPIVIENCIGDITGTPDAFPLNGVSIGSTLGEANDVCMPPGHLNMNGGDRQALLPKQSLWETIFGADTNEADIKLMQGLMPLNVMFIDAGYPYHPSQPTFGTQWHTDVGTSTAPVILYIAAGHADSCLKINGSTVIYGLVYYADPGCSSSGFGGGEIHGTLAKTGDMTKLNSNTELIGTDLDFGGDSGGGGTSIDIGVTAPQFTEIPGSWRDF